MKKATKLMALLLAVLLVGSSLAACTTSNPTEAETKATEKQTEAAPTETETAPEETVAPIEQDDRLAKDVLGNSYSPENWEAESNELYESILGDFLEAYAKVENATSLSERYALQAIAEGIMLGSAVFVPTTTKGGNYRIGRTIPKSVNTTLWGSNEYRYHTILVVTELLKAEDWDALKALWAEKAGTGTYIESAKAYVTSKGYTLKDEYVYAYTSDPTTWDNLASSRQTTGEPCAVTVDGLYVYNEENQQVPAIATSYEVSADGLTYTFKLRNDVVWVDSQGREIGKLVADDFVAGLNHLMDCESSPRGLLVGVLKNAAEYINGDITDFSQVGIKAVDDYTLEYTLAADCPYFMSMMAYNIFLPMSRSYYESKGGTFGAEYAPEDTNYTYGDTPDDICYCGPMIITGYTANNTVVFEANPSYYNKDALNVKKITWLYAGDNTDATKSYMDCINGVIDAVGLNEQAVAKCKEEGKFETYVSLSETDSTTYCGWINVNRKIYTNFNSEAVASPKTMTEATISVAALQNTHFRRALLASFDRASYNEQSVGAELKYNALRNSYTPATFVSLSEDVTVDINGVPTTFKAGTFYGQIMQAQLDADGVPFKVWDDSKASGDGYDGWYNPEFAKSELELAIADLAKLGITVDKDHPVCIDYPHRDQTEVQQNTANAVKQSIEAASGGLIKINLIACSSADEYRDSSYNTQYGYEQNDDFTTSSGWGPDYGDPQTYLATLVIDQDGYMLANLGMFGQ